MCRPNKKAWKKSPRTLNPSIHMRARDDDMCAWIFLSACCFSTTRKMRFTWIHGCWFCLFLCFFSFPFINSVLKSVSSSMFACVYHCANDAYKNESLKGKGYFCEYSSVDCLPWTLNVKFGVFDHFALFSISSLSTNRFTVFSFHVT